MKGHIICLARTITLLALCLVAVLAIPASAQHYSQGTEPVYKGAPSANCACHDSTTGRLGKLPGYLTTNHWIRAYDGVTFTVPGCFQCHVTGWDTSAANGGFDDYYLVVPRNTTGMAEMKSVLCEACHKPYTAGTGYDTSMAATKCQSCHGNALCLGCHPPGDRNPTFDNWILSKHAVSKYTSIPGGAFGFIPSDSNCAACHTANGFVQWSKQTRIDPRVSPSDTSISVGITCAACHDPHNNTNKAQLRLPVDQICTKCHNPEYDVDAVTVGWEIHHSTAYMFEGKGGYHYAGWTYNSSEHKLAIHEKCVRCHMKTIPYRVGLPLGLAYTGHKFEPRQEACLECHADFDRLRVFDYRNTQTRCDSLATALADLLATASNAQDSASLGWLRAKFNYDFYEADGSHGVHNTKYAEGLLQSSIANFSLTQIKQQGSQIPMTYELKQNYPNPFNPSTTIRYALPTRSHVTLTVYNTLGQQVATLVSGEQEAGFHEAVFDASGLASGVYLYRLTAGSYVEALKLVVVR